MRTSRPPLVPCASGLACSTRRLHGRSYNKGVRTGLGVYTFSNNGARKVSGTYAGEWLKGAFHGLGSLTYSDGEMYIGTALHASAQRRHMRAVARCCGSSV